MANISALEGAALGAAAAATVILIWYLVRRPELTGAVKLVLFFGIGVLPIGAALTGNVAGFEASKQRDFCGSCHVMEPWVNDAESLESKSLASRHAKNPWFGDENCYTCHADYGMYGAVVTKINGLGHVWAYFVKGGKDLTTDEAARTLHLYHPYPNRNCMQCHSTETPNWRTQPDHRGLALDVRAGDISCVSEGCHGPSHPVGAKDKKSSKLPAKARQEVERQRAAADAGADAEGAEAAEEGGSP